MSLKTVRKAMRILVERGETLLFDRQFDDRTIYVGRQEGCHICLTGDASVTGRHLMILEEQGQWYVEPLHDPLHRSLLNGQALYDRQPVNDRDELLVGHFKISLFPSDRPEERAVPIQVVARTKSELEETEHLTAGQMGVASATVIKDRSGTFSLAKGRLEYVSALASQVLDLADVRAMMGMVIGTLLADYQASCVWIALRTDDEGHLELSAGKDASGRAADGPPLAQQSAFAVVECGRPVLYQNCDAVPGRSAMAVPLVGSSGSLGMVYLESRSGQRKFTVADLDTLMFVAAQLAIALDRALREQTAQLDQMDSLNRELARKVQARIAPWQLPQWPKLSVAVFSQVGRGACTDFYDVLPRGQTHAMCLIGHAGETEGDTALAMAEVYAAFRIGAVHQDAPQVLLRQINWLIFTTRGEPRTLSAAVLAIDPQSGQFRLCHAGRIFGYVIDSGGRAMKIRVLNRQFVGESRKAKYDAVEGCLAPNQTLALCTEGIFSVTSPQGRTFTENQLLDLLADSYTHSSATILSDLADDISAFTAGQGPDRDITLLLLRKAGEP